jgi:predicted nucleic acid-binding protein
VKRLLLDTNVAVRFLLGETTAQGRAAAAVFAKCDRREVILVLEPLVLAETIFVLTSFYQKPRQSVADTLAALIQSPGIECAGRTLALRALKTFKDHPKIHWVDCFLGALSAEAQLQVVSIDTDFDRLEGVRRCDPSTLT